MNQVTESLVLINAGSFFNDVVIHLVLCGGIHTGQCNNLLRHYWQKQVGFYQISVRNLLISIKHSKTSASFWLPMYAVICQLWHYILIAYII